MNAENRGRKTSEDESSSEAIDDIFDLIIIGGGPAGLTASIYAGRAELDVAAINGPSPGGQIINTSTLENFPGFPSGVEGAELAQKMMEQARRFSAELKFEEVVDVELDAHPFLVETYMASYKTKSLIIATGASPRKLGLKNEEKLTGRGVSYCATCDGAMHKDEVVAVVGGGDSALEEADYLTQFARKVYLVHRREEYRAGPGSVELVKNNDRIEPVLNAEVSELRIEDGGLGGLILENNSTGEEFVLDDVKGLFISIGYNPNSDLFCPSLECDERGYIYTDDLQQTNIEGVFAAGDVQDNRFQQVITASASGAKAAMEANRYLRRISE